MQNPVKSNINIPVTKPIELRPLFSAVESILDPICHVLLDPFCIIDQCAVQSLVKTIAKIHIDYYRIEWFC